VVRPRSRAADYRRYLAPARTQILVTSKHHLEPENNDQTRQWRAHWLSFGAWWVLLMSGYVYVAGILCQRQNPFESGNSGAREIVLLTLLSPLLYLLGPRHNWQSDAHSAVAILKWNGACYLLPFFTVLHWEFLGDAIGAQFSLKPADLSSLSPRSLAVLVVATIAIVSILTSHLFWARREGILYPYASALFGILFLIAVITIILSKTHYIHVHHYCLGAFLFPFFRFRNVLSLAAQAVFLGLLVEGISRWGMDPLWYPAVS